MEYKNILIIKMSSVGDIIHALPFAAALRERYPEAKISWLVHPQFAGFIPEAPTIDQVLYFDKEAFKKMSWGEKFSFIKAFRQELQARHFDLVVDLQGLFKSGAVAFLTGAPNKIGYWEMREGSGLVSRPIKGAHAHDHVIERYLDVARYLGAEVKDIVFPLPRFDVESDKVKAMLLAAGLGEKEPYITMAPGARWETKQWPKENFAKLAQLFMAEGFPVVLVGGKADEPLGQAICAMVNSPQRLINLVGKTNLSELAALLKDTYFYVSADTGPLHIANAYGKPLIAIYGPTRPNRTGPYGNPRATVLQAKATCVGCLKKHCDDWHCMQTITPGQVLVVFKQMMGVVHVGARW